MKLSLFSVAAALAALMLSADALTPAPTTAKPTPKPATTNKLAADCNQAQRQLINKLLQQNVNPAKSCYAKAKGDITELSTSRLCPIEACKVWLNYMADSAPDCIYDDRNYGREFVDKARDCESPSASAASGSNDDDLATTKPTKTKAPVASGSESDSGSVGEETPEPTTEEPASSGSASTSIDVLPIDNTTVTIPDETPEPVTAAPPPSSASSVAMTVCTAALTVVAASLAL